MLTNKEEFRKQCEANAERIYVREQNPLTGEWVTIPFSSLTEEQKDKWVSKWVEERRLLGR